MRAPSRLALLLAAAVWAAPQSADSAVTWPVVVDVDLTWTGYGPSSTCWRLNQDRSFTDCTGNTGTWEVDVPGQSMTVTYAFGTVYTGDYTGVPICAAGTMMDPFGSSGTWSGCKR